MSDLFPTPIRTQLRMNAEEEILYRANGYIKLNNIFTQQEIQNCSTAYNELFASKRNNYNLEATWDGDWKRNHQQGEKGSAELSVTKTNSHCYIF